MQAQQFMTPMQPQVMQQAPANAQCWTPVVAWEITQIATIVPTPWPQNGMVQVAPQTAMVQMAPQSGLMQMAPQHGMVQMTPQPTVIYCCPSQTPNWQSAPVCEPPVVMVPECGREADSMSQASTCTPPTPERTPTTPESSIPLSEASTSTRKAPARQRRRRGGKPSKDFPQQPPYRHTEEEIMAGVIAEKQWPMDFDPVLLSKSDGQRLLSWIEASEHENQPGVIDWLRANRANTFTGSSDNTNTVWELAKLNLGTRIVQAVFKRASDCERTALAYLVKGHVKEAASHPHANHFAQQIIEGVGSAKILFFLEELQEAGVPVFMAKNNFGCRVLQRLLEHFAPETVETLASTLLEDEHIVFSLLIHKYGNFVMQGLLEHCPHARDAIGRAILRGDPKKLENDVIWFCRHRYTSHIVEKALRLCCEEHVKIIVEKVMCNKDILKDAEFGSFVLKLVQDTVRMRNKRSREMEVGVAVSDWSSDHSAAAELPQCGGAPYVCPPPAAAWGTA
eukprot:gnl/TRDRNA2_/TRDRNA2_36127_c1_seq1.p1 gnl/TRDRNA2_/TRDRNA2_36127_c1~~gnl/TRDRNA2_/TRDRNA2_36127_c1_seq1.p1  ORF type:complete len:508 (-),score=93.68 gnl/TRDRNA2_/TRDRNA2_36127_c1_seq1:49-1572(-)